jgi:S1-C subfamily serine protease
MIVAGVALVIFRIDWAEARSHVEGRVGVPAMVARVLPSVVSITTRQIERDQFNQPVPTRGPGSGFVIARQGYVRGTLVSRVEEAGAGQAAGIEPGDVVTSVGKPIIDLHHFHEELAGHRIGDSVDVSIWRDGQAVTLSLTLEEEP